MRGFFRCRPLMRGGAGYGERRPYGRPGLIERLLPHALIVLCVMLLTFFVITIFNPAMGFLRSEITDWLILCCSVLGVACAALLIRYQRRL